MNIQVFDSNNGRFSNVLRFHWQRQGHTVGYTPLWDSRECVDKDVVFFDWVDTSVQRASNPEDQQYKDHGTQAPYGKNIIARCHDIDMWAGNLRGVRDNFIRHLVFVAPHVRRVAEEDGDIPKGCQVHMIPHGIDPEKFTLRQPNGQKKIGWVGNFEHKKNPELALQVMLNLPRNYTLYMCARRRQPQWQIKYWDALIARNNLSVVFENDIPDMNAWWEDKDYCLVTSQKEAFSYVAGEAMMKGIRPYINHFWGAEEVWPGELLFDNATDIAVDIQNRDGYSLGENENLRRYVVERYPIDKFYKAYDELLRA